MEEDGTNVFQDQTTDYNFKLILVGNSQVGKTSVTSRYINDEFNEDEKRSRQVKI